VRPTGAGTVASYCSDTDRGDAKALLHAGVLQWAQPLGQLPERKPGLQKRPFVLDLRVGVGVEASFGDVDVAHLVVRAPDLHVGGVGRITRVHLIIEDDAGEIMLGEHAANPPSR